MSMRSQTPYKQSISKPDIITVLEREGLRLQQRGQAFWVLCPLHSERTASFKVDPDRQSFYCFGCQEHGDVITFVRLLHGFSFKEALRHLGIDSSGYKKPNSLNVVRQKALVEAFMAWEREMRDLLSYLLRIGRRKIANIETEAELEKWADLIRSFDYYEYCYEILCGRNDRSKYELYRQERGY